MKKQIVIRAAVLAALSLAAAILTVFALDGRNNGTVQAVRPMPESYHVLPLANSMESAVATSPAPLHGEALPTVSPETTVSIPVSGTEREGVLFTLIVAGESVPVAYGVEEATLTRMPGWLPSSALPGQDGMCVVYGHRNRNHLKALENVERVDAITVAMDGVAYVYTVSDIMIYDSTDDFRLPTMDGKTLVLATCYPFRYSGHAPGKVAFLLSQQDDDFNQENSDRYDR